MSKKSPQLRFEGFTDDWEQRKLTDITSSYSGLTYSPTDVQDKGTFVLRSSNVKNDQLIDADNVYVNPDIVNSNNVKVGDVIVVVRNGSRSLIGKHAIVTKEMPHTVIGAFMSAFRGENGDYINALLSTNNFQKEVHKSLGATINQITGKDFSMMNFQTPKLEEQNKIGSFFKQLDNTIALHQRKLDLLKEQKKGYLQKMFPKNGEKVPELRFTGFADDWEERKLGEYVNFLNGRAYKQSELLDKGKYKVVRVGNFNTNDRWYYSDLELDQDKYAHKGDLLYLWATNFGPEIWSEEKVIYHYHIWKLELLNNNLDKQYLYTWLVTDKERIKQNTNGTTMVHVTKGNMEQRDFQFPGLNEQQKIGSFFKQLDKTIALHQRKLDLLKEQKKGFLQKMFV